MTTTAATLLSADFLRRLDRLSLRSRRVYRGTLRGERRSRTQGRGMEFSDYRSYQSGDDYRYIDWNIYSRLDRLFIKLFSEEEDINVHLMLDASASMAWGEPSKLEYAARIAAAVGYVGLTNFDRVGAVTFAQRLQRVLPPQRSRGQVLRLFEFLASATAGGRTHLAEAVSDYVHLTHRRGLLVLISDLLLPAGFEAGLKLARYHRFEPFLIHVLSDDELFPGVEGDLRLVDAESRASVEITADGPALDAYGRARDGYFAEIERFCLRHQIEYLRTATSIPFDDLILRYLRVGGLIA
ncbi:MAG: DUF58 domain-containing protein [bacterium]